MINYKLAILTLIPLLASCVSGRDIARKERIEDGKDHIMAEWDVNLDGIVTCVDLELKKIEQFNNSDLDKNKLLDASEFKVAPWGNKVFSVELLRSYDQNNDRQVSQQEFSAKPNAFFSSLDKNKDCTVSKEEIEQSLTERRSPKPKSRGGRAGGHGGGQHSH